MCQARTVGTIFENAPKYSSGSMGATEVANRLVEEQIRTIRGRLEQVLKFEIGTTDPAVPWVVGHACWLLNLYRVMLDGCTPYRACRNCLASGAKTMRINKPILCSCATFWPTTWIKVMFSIALLSIRGTHFRNGLPGDHFLLDTARGVVPACILLNQSLQVTFLAKKHVQVKDAVDHVVDLLERG